MWVINSVVQAAALGRATEFMFQVGDLSTEHCLIMGVNIIPIFSPPPFPLWKIPKTPSRWIKNVFTPPSICCMLICTPRRLMRIVDHFLSVCKHDLKFLVTCNLNLFMRHSTATCAQYYTMQFQIISFTPIVLNKAVGVDIYLHLLDQSFLPFSCCHIFLTCHLISLTFNLFDLYSPPPSTTLPRIG